MDGTGMELLSLAVNASFTWLDQIPQKGRHLDTLEPRDRLFIWLNRLTAVPFVYHLLYTCHASPSIQTLPQVISACSALCHSPAYTPTVSYANWPSLTWLGCAERSRGRRLPKLTRQISLGPVTRLQLLGLRQRRYSALSALQPAVRLLATQRCLCSLLSALWRARKGDSLHTVRTDTTRTSLRGGGWALGGR